MKELINNLSTKVEILFEVVSKQQEVLELFASEVFRLQEQIDKLLNKEE